MKIALMSDLHCDIGIQPDVVFPEADVLIVAGDTANTVDGLMRFLDEAIKHYPNVLFVDGNHEHYSNASQDLTIEETLAKIVMTKPKGSVFLPSRDTIKIDDVYFVGRNGWYSCDSALDPLHNQMVWRDTINDNKCIGFDVVLREGKVQPYPWELASQHAEEIDEIITQTVEKDPQAKFVVVTHTAPSPQTVSQDPRYLATNPFYINMRMIPVMEKWSERIIMWKHGHTHHRRQKTVFGIPVLVNPRGYPNENPRWEPVVIEL